MKHIVQFNGQKSTTAVEIQRESETNEVGLSSASTMLGHELPGFP
jgi:hypothetical protein